jgi:putative hydrolase of the HAD superfamily
VLRRLEISDSDSRIANSIVQAFKKMDYLKLYPDCLDALTQLRKEGHILGIISNSTEQILADLKALKIREFFDTVTFSQEAGSEKPEPAIFKKALERARLPAEQCIYVGDSYGRDVVGARKAGLLRCCLTEPCGVTQKERMN